MSKGPIRSLECCVCGGGAGRWHQHWNRDTDYGVCARCVCEEYDKIGPEEVESCYGKPGENFEPFRFAVQAHAMGTGWMHCRTACFMDEALRLQRELVADDSAWMKATVERRTRIVPFDQRFNHGELIIGELNKKE